MLVRDPKNLIKEEVIAGTKTFKQVLISSDEAPNFVMRKFTIEPKGSMPLHINEVEFLCIVPNQKDEIKIVE